MGRVNFRPCLITVFFSLLSLVHLAQVRAGGVPSPPNAPSVSPEPAKSYDTKFIPLPIYATLPNEGDTFGAMGVFLKVRTADQRTDTIYAPSLSWNRIIQNTATFRLYGFPAEHETYTFIASASTHVNWNSLFIW